MMLERIEDVALLRLRGGKANAMTREFLRGLEELFDRVEESDARAIVMIGYEKYFSAGLALPQLITLDRTAMSDFMDTFNATMLRVFRSERPIVAAINGHAIAGGCVLALMADLRLIAAGNIKIGLNEVQLGIGLPSIVVEPLKLQLPASSLAKVALEGALFTPEDAYKHALVDEVVEPEKLEESALARAALLARAPRTGVSQVKRALRREAIEAIEKHGEEERDRWLDTWFSPQAKHLIESTVEKLRKT